ncbi:uncharacterized protein LOC128961209 [Oppia nitens]|uniref:uncharacterized protein LOC128961209 n=1 Tax=Oppia nitens TaxID=1686743 RepID=UPI0023DCA222|nr:uncharacterized protein LOC128961209 [Oppia nitens]
MYATKRRRRNSKSIRVQPKDGQTKSNPSKRHRERLNSELDMLASLLPYEQSVLSKLDKLSILRLSVSYLRTKSYFHVAIHKERHQHHQGIHDAMAHHKPPHRELHYPEALMEGDLILQALNGFLLILTCDGEVFYTSHTVETYLGFHQSDICHQSVYELVHSEDREELQRHLMWNSHLPNDRSSLTLQEVLLQDNCQLLERNFTVRFRCLLDNTSGFLRLDIRGRIKVLHGQNHKSEEPPMALFAVCTPFGPPSLLEMPQKDSMFKSKHKLDLSLVSMDQRGRQLLGYSDSELANKGGYDLVHYDDLAYVASAHQELLKTGASGLIAYRLVTKESKWQWLQTSARLVYKNSKPDFILCTHRPLMEEEGRDLLGKRTMDFKVTYLDGGLGAMTDRSGFLSDSDFVMRCQRSRRYKSQIRDVVTNCKPTGKRKQQATNADTHTYTAFEDNSGVNAVNVVTHAAAVTATAAGYQNSTMYPYSDNMNGLSTYAAAAAAVAMPQNLFSAAIDHNSRPFLAPENFLHYSRHALGPYYPEYHPAAQYPTNGFLDHMTTSRTTHCFPGGYNTDTNSLVKENNDKLYGCQMTSDSKFPMNESVTTNGRTKTSCCDSYMSSATTPCSLMTTPTSIQAIHQPLLADTKIADIPAHRNFGINSAPNDCLSVIKHKASLPILTANSVSHRNDHNNIDSIATTSQSTTSQSILSAFSTANNIDSRQSVLMWGTNHNFAPRNKYGLAANDIKPNERVVSCKWNGSIANPKPLSPHPSVAHSPSSAKVPMSMPITGYSTQAYITPDVPPIEQPLAKQLDYFRGIALIDGCKEINPLLTISEVTNTLLNQ